MRIQILILGFKGLKGLPVCHEDITVRGQLCYHYTFLGTCPPTPPLSKHFVLSEKKVLMLA